MQISYLNVWDENSTLNKHITALQVAHLTYTNQPPYSRWPIIIHYPTPSLDKRHYQEPTHFVSLSSPDEHHLLQTEEDPLWKRMEEYQDINQAIIPIIGFAANLTCMVVKCLIRKYGDHIEKHIPVYNKSKTFLLSIYYRTQGHSYSIHIQLNSNLFYFFLHENSKYLVDEAWWWNQKMFWSKAVANPVAI